MLSGNFIASVTIYILLTLPKFVLLCQKRDLQSVFFWWKICQEAYHVECQIHAFTNERVCRRSCSNLYGYFSLFGMMECHPWLDCNQISRLRIIKLIGEGHVKKAYLAKWNDYNVVINVEKTKMYRNDFLSNIERHRVLNPSSYISQFLGWCNHTYLVEYYPLGASINIHNYLADALPSQNTIDRRFTLCIDYVKILAHLHNHRNGPFVFCDSNHVHKINLQLLLTNDLHLVLNDLDALPVNNGNGIICGQRQLDGDLLAPEQLWPYENKTFDIKLMPSYTEKIDIWKIPDVCDYFLEELNADSLRFSLIRINERCKARKPSLRPSADIVLKEYLEIAKHHGINIL